MLVPFLPALPDLPHRCRKTLGSLGGSICNTRSMFGMSSPLAATSVVRRMAGAAESEKAAKFLSLTLAGNLPWSGTSLKAC